ncbi:hypothetical protein RSAG8_12059, partial [Rhizoctonia solani AG-8 WAC10335]
MARIDYPITQGSSTVTLPEPAEMLPAPAENLPQANMPGLIELVEPLLNVLGQAASPLLRSLFGIPLEG